jgi:ABC-type Zn uptake system ZnuABC Zn-binding protein ZnuA
MPSPFAFRLPHSAFRTPPSALAFSAFSFSAPAPRPLTIVTSFYPIHITTLNVAGTIPGVRVRRLAPPQTGCLHDYQLTPGDLKTIRIIRASGIHALFAEPQYPPKAAEIIANETGARLYALDPAVTGPDTPDAYLQIMAANARTLAEALR